MTMLSHQSIVRAAVDGPLGIVPFNLAQVQPSSYDLRVNLREPLELEPRAFHLLETEEWVCIPDSMQATVYGRSSIGRLAVLVHFTAGFIDPGFEGTITLEVMNLGTEPVTLKPGDRIAQIAFTWLDEPTQRPYRGRYQGQLGAQASRFRHGDD